MRAITILSNTNEPIAIHDYGFEDDAPNARWGRGARDSYILHYVLSGRGYFNSISVSAGQGFLIYPKQMHEYHSSLGEPWAYFWVIFSGDGAGSAVERYLKTDKNGIFGFGDVAGVASLKDVILASDSLDATAALGYFYLLMSHTNLPCHCSIDNAYVEAAKKYMQINLYRSIKITEVAASIGISDRYLYNLFIKHEKISPKAYLNRLRVKRAKAMLSATGCAVTEAAVSVGFADVLSFSKFFSKFTGCSPSEYRNKKYTGSK